MEHFLHNQTAGLNLISSNTAVKDPVSRQRLIDVDVVANRLPTILQTTLELEELISLFDHQIRQTLAFNGLVYTNADAGCHLNIGKPSHHSCNYRLDINGTWLGDLTLTSRNKFSEQDLQDIENLLCKLVYPLRNCLMYRQAMASALQDPLTGLNNRGAFDASLDRELDLAKRHNTPLSLVVLDIDNFKQINDAYGHSSGDRALTTLANAITSTLRRSDIAFRYGGEEFTLILSNTDAEAARLVAERVRIAVSQLCCNDGERTFGFTISLGIAQMSTQDNGYSLFDRADKALYSAKKSGRNLTVCAALPDSTHH